MKKEDLKQKIKRVEAQAQDYLNKREGKPHNENFDDFADELIANIAIELHLRITKTFLKSLTEICEILTDIIEKTEKEEINTDELIEMIADIEPITNIYIFDLTAWLHEDDRTIDYLTEAMQEYELNDGFKALTIAQMLYKKTIWHEFIHQIYKTI